MDQTAIWSALFGAVGGVAVTIAAGVAFLFRTFATNKRIDDHEMHQKNQENWVRDRILDIVGTKRT